MNLSYIPDAATMALLLTVLLLVRKRHSKLNIDSWLIALVFVLLSTVSQIMPAPTVAPFPFLLHFIQLLFELLAGLAFVYGAENPAFSNAPRDAYWLWNTPAPLAFSVLFGWYSHVYWAYGIVIGVGAAITCISGILLRNRRVLAACQLAVWAGMGVLTYQQALHPDALPLLQYLRWATYMMVGSVYLVAAFAFLRNLPSRSIGKFTVVVGLVVWAGSLFLHPLTVMSGYRIIADQIRYIQKFLVSTGLLLLLLEDQVSTNQWLALHDQLTGLANRRLLEDRLPHAIASAQRTRTPVTLFLFDLNGFKKINDTLGHSAGDRLLKHVAASLKTQLRVTDTLARMGGDEFVLIAPGMGEEEDIRRFLQSIEAIIRTPIVLAGQSVTVSCSVGYAVYPVDDPGDSSYDKTADHLLDVADRRMYALKLARKAGLHDAGADTVIEIDLASDLSQQIA